MYPKSLLLLFIPIFLYSCNAGPFKTTYKTIQEHYPEGQIKKVTILKTKRYQSSNLYSFFQREISQTYEYSKDSVLIRDIRRTIRQGDGGGGCYLVIEKKREYYEDGSLKKDVLIKCDGKKVITRYFSKAGKMTFKQVDKRYL